MAVVAVCSRGTPGLKATSRPFLQTVRAIRVLKMLRPSWEARAGGMPGAVSYAWMLCRVWQAAVAGFWLERIADSGGAGADIGVG